MFCSFVVEINQKLNIEIMKKSTYEFTEIGIIMKRVTYQYKCTADASDYLTIEPLQPYDRVSFEIENVGNPLNAQNIIFNKMQIQQMIRDLQEVEKTMT